jgi:hypothetical protein
VGAPLHHCARTAFGFRSRIAHAQLCRAHRPPLVAAFPRRLPPSLRTASWSVAISLVARAARGYRGHARRPLAAHAPRARASTSPGTADGRELGALKHALSLRLSSLKGKPRRHRARTRDAQKPTLSRQDAPRARRGPHVHVGIATYRDSAQWCHVAGTYFLRTPDGRSSCADREPRSEIADDGTTHQYLKVSYL